MHDVFVLLFITLVIMLFSAIVDGTSKETTPKSNDCAIAGVVISVITWLFVASTFEK